MWIVWLPVILVCWAWDELAEWWFGVRVRRAFRRVYRARVVRR